MHSVVQQFMTIALSIFNQVIGKSAIKAITKNATTLQCKIIVNKIVKYCTNRSTATAN